MTESKTCRGCAQTFPVEQFNKRKRNPDGLHTRCRECDGAYQRAARKRRLGSLNIGDRYGFTCARCRERHEVDYVSGPRRTYCTPCYELGMRERVRLKYRQYDLKKKYGITEADYADLLRRQDGCCAICRADDPGGRHGSGAFCVDHDHESGQVRGLLCHGCNAGIGCLQDDPRLIAAAARYVQDHRQLRVVV